MDLFSIKLVKSSNDEIEYHALINKEDNALVAIADVQDYGAEGKILIKKPFSKFQKEIIDYATAFKNGIFGRPLRKGVPMIEIVDSFIKFFKLF